MATTLAHLLVRLGADSREFREQLRGAEVRLKKFAGSAKSFGNALTLGVTAPMLAVGGLSLKMAMDVVESENLVAESFGGMTDAVTKWSQEFSEALGLNEYEVRQQAATLKVMLESMGLTEKQAYDMALGMTELAVDMESFYNLPHGEAFDKIRSGLSGEAEPLKRLGILVNENTIKQIAYREGLAKTGEELTEQQKVQARFIAIMEQTSKAQGDAARTMDSPINQLRALRNQLTKTAIEFGKALIPVLQEALPVVKDVAGMVRSAAEAFAAMDPEARKTAIQIAGVLVVLGPLTRGMGTLASATHSGVKMLRQAVDAARRLGKVQATTASSAIQLSSASRKTGEALKIANGQAIAMKGSLVVLAATIGYSIGSAIRPWVEEVLNLNEKLDLVADKHADVAKGWMKNSEQFEDNLRMYDHMREKLGLVGEEWQVNAELTEENALKLAKLLPEVQKMVHQQNEQIKTQRELNRVQVDGAAQVERYLHKIHAQDAAIDEVTRRTRELYGVMSQREAEEQMALLVRDFQLLARDGIPASKLMEAFGPEVQKLQEATEGYVGLNLPDSFSQLTWALQEGGESMVAALATSLANQIPAGAETAQAALEGSIGQAMLNAKGKVDEETKAITSLLRDMAGEDYEIKVKVQADFEQFMRQLKEMGLEPETTGSGL